MWRVLTLAAVHPAYAQPTVKGELVAARARVRALDQAIASGSVGDGGKLWGGAGLVVAIAMPEAPYEQSHRYVITPYGANLSWMLRALHVAFRPLLDSVTKPEFFGRLGNAALRYQHRAGAEEDRRDLLGAVVHEAYDILDDIEHDRFRALPVAPAGVVYDDLQPDAQHDDVLSDLELAQWFQDHGIR